VGFLPHRELHAYKLAQKDVGFALIP
jgi:hypothetical protein